jgi:spore germination protein YaaH
MYKDVSKIKNALGMEDDKPSAEDAKKMKEGLATPEQQNMLRRYGYLYDFLNPNNPNKLKANNFYWDSVQQIYFIKSPTNRKLSKKYEVFGWHPHWMGTAWESYDFSLLSTIAYFAYIVDPETGSYSNPAQMQEWRTTSMVDTAKAYGTRVLLSMASHGVSENDRFLSNPAAWNTFTDSISSLIIARNADGVDLNFENVPEKHKESLVNFVTLLRTNLSNKMPSGNVFLSITLPSYSTRDAFDHVKLGELVDLMVIMGYDYHKGKGMTGAVSPLRTTNRNGISLQSTLDYYVKNKLDVGKTVLALPYYGAQWKGKINSKGVYDTYFDKDVPYREVMNLYGTTYTSQYDFVSMTNYFFLEFGDSTSVECWYDDASTLEKKYNLALSYGLKGVGIWALGYDNGYTDLWQLIDNRFTSDTTGVVNPINEAEGFPVSMGSFMLKYRDILTLTYLLFALSVIIGWVIAFADWRVRTGILGQQFFRYLFMLIMTLLLVPLLSIMNWFTDERIIILIAFLFGALVFYFIQKMQVTFNTKRP